MNEWMNIKWMNEWIKNCEIKNLSKGEGKKSNMKLEISLDLFIETSLN